MSISVGDFVKFSARTLVNPYREFTISFGKSAGMAKRNENREFSEDSLYLNTYA